MNTNPLAFLDLGSKLLCTVEVWHNTNKLQRNNSIIVKARFPVSLVDSSFSTLIGLLYRDSMLCYIQI